MAPAAAARYPFNLIRILCPVYPIAAVRVDFRSAFRLGVGTPFEARFRMQRRTSMGLTPDSFQSIRFATPQRLLGADRLMTLAAEIRSEERRVGKVCGV